MRSIFIDTFLKPDIRKGWYVLIESRWIPVADSNGFINDYGQYEAKAYGYFVRLKGDIISTEWEGPFNNKTEANKHMVTTYA